MSAMRGRLRDLHDAEDAVALVSVIGLTGIMTLIAVVALNFALNAQPAARHHQDWNAALAAAEAGLDDYLARLNRDRAYYETATPADPRGNAALDGWAQVPNSDAFFHYQIDASETSVTGTVHVVSTGLVNGVTRTVQASFRPQGFLDFIYFTDFEVVDPAMMSYSEADCARYHYGDNPRNDVTCAPIIRFIGADVIDGPMHSNDAILIQGDATFLGPVTTSWPDPDERYWRNTFESNVGTVVYTSNPDFREGIGYDAPKNMPPTNAAIRDQATAEAGGCLYYGPTYIHLDGDRMRVRSPQSATAPSGQPPTAGPCRGTNLTDTGYIPLPSNGVIYVANKLSQSCSTHPLGLPRADDSTSYTCNVGDVFIHGELDGQLTVAAENNVTILWDLTYTGGWEDDSSDLLGLIADNYVQIYHPVTSGGTNLAASGPGLPPFIDAADTPTTTAQVWNDPEIHGALLSLNRSFRVQNYNRGARFTEPLSVRGAIAQRFRGPVGTSGGGTQTGYDKDYVYDYRLRYLSPPHFIEPIQSQFTLRAWAELGRPSGLPPLP